MLRVIYPNLKKTTRDETKKEKKIKKLIKKKQIKEWRLNLVWKLNEKNNERWNGKTKKSRK